MNDPFEQAGGRSKLADLALAYHVPDEDQPLEAVIPLYYDLSKVAKPKDALGKAVIALRAANPWLKAVAPRGQPLMVPLLPGLPATIMACVQPFPTLPDSPPPPDPTPLENPPYATNARIGEVVHRSHSRPGCVYFWEFFKKTGPVQEREFRMGTVVWVRFEGRSSYLPVGDTVTTRYCVYEADRLVVRRWEWQEIIGMFTVECGEPGGDPARRFGTARIAGKWVLLGDVKRTGRERLIHTEWTLANQQKTVAYADAYVAAGGGGAERGADELP